MCFKKYLHFSDIDTNGTFVILEFSHIIFQLHVLGHLHRGYLEMALDAR